MNAQTAHSHLQNRLLLALRQEAIVNLAALARKLQVQRPSLSRAMHALNAEGLVIKENNAWRLTPAGEAAALLIVEQIPERTRRTGITVRRLMEQGQLAGTPAEPLIHDMLAPLREAAASAVKPSRALIDQMAALSKPSADLLTGAKQFAALAAEHEAVAAQIARVQAPIDAVASVQSQLAHDIQPFAAARDSVQSLIAAQNRQFAEVAQSLAATAIDKAQLLSVHQNFLAEGAKLAGLASAYDGAAAQAAKSAQAYESTIASVMRDTAALPSAQLAAARLADLAPATKLFDMALPTAATLDAIKQLALVPSPVELAASQILQMRDSSAASWVAVSSRLAREAVSSFAESQRLNLSLIERAAGWEHASAAIVRDLDIANQRLGGVLSDIGAIRVQAFAEPDRVTMAADLMPNVAAVARTYRGYITEVAADAMRREANLDYLPIALPTQTTAGLIQTVRAAVVLEREATDDTAIDRISRLSPWERQAGFVDQVLERQGPQFVRLWSGSWAVLGSDSPDRVRQAAHSGRELLMQLLALLAPDEVFTPEELKDCANGRPTRKMRVRRILTNRSTAAVNLIDSIAATLDDLYNRLAGISHDRSVVPQTSEQMVAGWLMTLGGLLTMLLDEGHVLE